MSSSPEKKSKQDRPRIIGRPCDDEVEVQADDILWLLASLMRKCNRVKVDEQSQEQELRQEQDLGDA